MQAQVGEKVHRCSLEWIETGLKCQGPFFSEQLQNQGHSNECILDPNDSKRTIVKGNEKINTCKFEITYQTGDTITNIIRDTSSTGYVNEQEKYNKLVLRPYKDYSVLRDTAVSITLIKIHKYNKIKLCISNLFYMRIYLR